MNSKSFVSLFLLSALLVAPTVHGMTAAERAALRARSVLGRSYTTATRPAVQTPVVARPTGQPTRAFGSSPAAFNKQQRTANRLQPFPALQGNLQRRSLATSTKDLSDILATDEFDIVGTLPKEKPWEILDISPDASFDEAKRAYEKKSKQQVEEDLGVSTTDPSWESRVNPETLRKINWPLFSAVAWFDGRDRMQYAKMSYLNKLLYKLGLYKPKKLTPTWQELMGGGE